MCTEEVNIKRRWDKKEERKGRYKERERKRRGNKKKKVKVILELQCKVKQKDRRFLKRASPVSEAGRKDLSYRASDWIQFDYNPVCAAASIVCARAHSISDVWAPDQNWKYFSLSHTS